MRFLLYSLRIYIYLLLFLFSIPQLQASKKIVVAVFNGSGAGEISVIETKEALKIDNGILPIEISASDIMCGKLAKVDVLIFPGGSGSKQLNNMGKQVAELVKKFAATKGKGILGICAGSFLLSSTVNYNSLAISDVTVVDRAHYDRGRGLIEFKLSEKGETIFPELKNKKMFVQYYDGPILDPLNQNNTLNEIGYYVTDIHPKTFDPIGITPNKLFIYNQNFEEGRIFAIGGHPESTPGMRWLVPRMARWIATQSIVNYNSKWISPEQNTNEIMFAAENAKLETKYWWNLFSDSITVQLNAMSELYKLRSRPAVRWFIGMLRDTDPRVRAYAAELIAKSEYSNASNDLKIALKSEKDQTVKLALKNAIEFLKYD